jgi:uncharacterized protein YdeI (BOF family)
MKTIIMAIAILLAGTATFAQAKKHATHKHHHSATAKKYTCPTPRSGKEQTGEMS